MTDKNASKEKYIHALPGETYFEDVFPIELIEDRMYIRKNASIAAGLELSLPNDEEIESHELGSLNEHLTSLISRLPVGTVVHKQDIYYFGKRDEEKIEVKGFFTSKIRQHLFDRPEMKFKSRIWLCFPKEDQDKMPSSTLFSLFKKIFPPNSFKDLQDRKEKAIGHLKNFANQLNKSYGIKTTIMNNDQLLDELYGYFNLEFDEVPNKMMGEIANNANSIKVGNKTAGFVFLKEPGAKQFVHVENNRKIQSAQGWPFGSSFIRRPHIVNQVIKVVNTEERIQKLESKAKQIRALSGITGRSNQVAAEQILQFVDALSSESKHLSLLNHNVMVWDVNQERLDETLDEVVAGYNLMNGSDAIKASFNAGNFFFSFSPGSALDMWDPIVMPLDQALCNFNWTKMNKGDRDGILVCNRDLEPVYMDLWARHLVNKNKLIIGPSGSGKSFNTNNLITQQHEKGYHQIIIDIGGSYRDYIETTGGKYIEYDIENPMALNPFLVPKDDGGTYHLTEDKKVFLLSVITIMWKNDGEKLTKEEESILTQFITRFYQSINRDIKKGKNVTPRLDLFVKFVEADHEHRLKKEEKYKEYIQYFKLSSLLLVLNDFVSGSYASIFASQDSTDITHEQLICFDMSNIRKNPTLYPIISLIIIELVLDKIVHYKDIRKELILDEAFEFLSGSMAGFIEKMYRQIRKANGAVTIATQGVSELKKSDIGAAIVQNASIKILLDHSSATSSIPEVQNYLGLTESEVEKLKSIRKSGSWREFFIKRMDASDVFALDVGVHAGSAFSTDPDDINKVNSLKKKYTNKELIFEQIAEEKLNGD